MPEVDPRAPLRRAFLVAYSLGLLLCVAWPLVLQVILVRAIPQPGATAAGLATELGYTFTGLTALTAIFVLRRGTKVRAGMPSLDPARQPGTLLREILLYSALFELSAAYGILCYAMGGPGAERYGRTFLALPPIMFFLFVPRWQKWRTASGR